MNWYAIKQVSTGFFLPQFGKNQSRGGTWLEPTDKAPPRLFKRKQDATAALNHWLKGKLTRSYRSPCGPDWVDEGDYDDEYQPVPERKVEDMTVVEILIHCRATAK